MRSDPKERAVVADALAKIARGDPKGYVPGAFIEALRIVSERNLICGGRLYGAEWIFQMLEDAGLLTKRDPSCPNISPVEGWSTVKSFSAAMRKRYALTLRGMVILEGIKKNGGSFYGEAS